MLSVFLLLNQRRKYRSTSRNQALTLVTERVVLSPLRVRRRYHGDRISYIYRKHVALEKGTKSVFALRNPPLPSLILTLAEKQSFISLEFTTDSYR